MRKLIGHDLLVASDLFLPILDHCRDPLLQLGRKEGGPRPNGGAQNLTALVG